MSEKVCATAHRKQQFLPGVLLPISSGGRKDHKTNTQKERATSLLLVTPFERSPQIRRHTGARTAFRRKRRLRIGRLNRITSKRRMKNRYRFLPRANKLGGTNIVPFCLRKYKYFPKRLYDVVTVWFVCRISIRQSPKHRKVCAT